MAVAHYLEALAWQKEIVKIHAIFGGKNPHPNYLVGGVPCSINLDEVNAINTERLNHVQLLIEEATQIVEQLYLPDLLTIAPFYLDWASIGGGLRNYMSYGDLPTRGYNSPDFFKFPRGAILDRNFNEVHEVNGRDAEEIKEYIAHSWYSYTGGDEQGLHPWQGETELNHTGPKPPFQHLNVDGKYSWIKTPRWRDHPMEVGPLARLLVGYASGSEEIRETVDGTLAALGVPLGALFSTLGRTAARGLETKLVVGWMREFFDRLVDNVRNGRTSTFTRERWDPSTWPEQAEGVGLTEAPRGALAHWIRIDDHKIDNYQLVVPSTWNASPRDAKGQLSSYEAALVGTPVADEEQPLEILRTVHSFDPCIACAVHLYDPQGRHIADVRIDH